MPSDNVCGAAVVDKDSAHIVSSEVHGILSDVGTNDEGVVVRVVLKPEISLGERDWNMGPRGVEVFAFAYMQDRVKVFFPLPLHLVYRSFDPPEMALITFTMPLAGSLALSGTWPGSSFGGGGRKVGACGAGGCCHACCGAEGVGACGSWGAEGAGSAGGVYVGL